MKAFSFETLSSLIVEPSGRVLSPCTERLVKHNDHKIKILGATLDAKTLAYVLIEQGSWDNFSSDFEQLIASPNLIEKVIKKLVPGNTVSATSKFVSGLQLSAILNDVMNTSAVEADSSAAYIYKGLLMLMLQELEVVDNITIFSRMFETKQTRTITPEQLLSGLLIDDLEAALRQLKQLMAGKKDNLGKGQIAVSKFTEILQLGVREFAIIMREISNKRSGFEKLFTVISRYLADYKDEQLLHMYGEALDSQDFQLLLKNATIVRIAINFGSRDPLSLPLIDALKAYTTSLLIFLQSNDTFKKVNDPYYGVSVKRHLGIGVRTELVSVVGAALGVGELTPIMVVPDVFSTANFSTIYELKDRHLSSLPVLPKTLTAEVVEHILASNFFIASNNTADGVIYFTDVNVQSVDIYEMALMLAPFAVYEDEVTSKYLTSWEVNFSNSAFAERLAKGLKTFRVNNVSLVLSLMAQDHQFDVGDVALFADESLPKAKTSAYHYGRWLVGTLPVEELEITIAPLSNADLHVNPFQYNLGRDLVNVKNVHVLVGAAWKTLKRELIKAYQTVEDLHEDLAMTAFKTALAIRLKDWLRVDPALAAFQAKVVQETAFRYVKENSGSIQLTDILYNASVRASIGLQLAYELIDVLGGGKYYGLSAKLIDNSIFNPAIA